MDEQEAEETRRFIDWPSLAMALLPLIAIGIDAWGIIYYRQGLRNRVMDFAPSALGVAVVLSLAIAGLLVRGYMLIKQRDPRTMFVGLLMLLVLMLWPAMCAVRPMPIERYRRGLADWARGHVDVNAIRAWHARLPAVSGPPVRLPASSPMPLAVTRLEPTLVEQHSNGIVMQWGTRATMPGRERKLFVAVDGSTQPPDEGRRFWSEVQPGMYVGAHGPP
jgi:hypothetical protein